MRCVCVLAGQRVSFWTRPVTPKADMAARFMSTRQGTLIPTDLTISAQRAVSLSIKA